MPPNVSLYKLFVFSNTLSNKRIWVYFLIYLKKRWILFTILIMIIVIKQSDKKCKKEGQNLFKVSPKSLISDYFVRFGHWLKQFRVLLPFFGEMS